MIRHDRIPVIDQLRGLAAISVAWFHLTDTYDGWVAASGGWGYLGVEAFFVISGFVIPYSLACSEQPYRLRDFPLFFARRIARLEPPYLASIALVVSLDLLAASTPIFHGAAPNLESRRLLSHLFYLIPLTNYKWINPVYWTLAYEFVFYLAVGLTFPLIGGLQWCGRAIAAVVIVLAAAGVISYLFALFVMGFAVHRRLAAGDGLGWTLASIATGAAAISARGAWAEAAIGAATALLILFHREIPSASGRFGATLTALGAISYSLYLVHVPIGGKLVNLGRRVVEGNLFKFALSLAALAVSVAAAVAFWRLVERPATLAARHLRTRARSLDPGAVASER